MKSVDVEELRARLPEYLRLARAGEVILVMDGEEVVAGSG